VYVGGRPAEELWREEPKIKRIRRRAQALRTKVQAVRRDVHRKICRFLCDNFDTIFPKLDTVSLSARRWEEHLVTDREEHDDLRSRRVQSVLGSLCQGPWCHRRSPLGSLHNQDVHRLWLC
jgi:hypothetical protein